MAEGPDAQRIQDADAAFEAADPSAALSDLAPEGLVRRNGIRPRSGDRLGATMGGVPNPGTSPAPRPKAATSPAGRGPVRPALPVVDVAALLEPDGDVAPVARAIDTACREVGFFYVTGHGVEAALGARLEEAARGFFALSEDEKSRIAMARAGAAWRGWFPVGGELTAGVPDAKEGLYFGTELGPDDSRVVAGRPLHGANLFPERPSDLRPSVLAYMDQMARVGQAIVGAMAVGLGLERTWFIDHLTADPVLLLRIFYYPPGPPGDGGSFGVGEHTDYGLVTLLGTDGHGGLEVRTPAGWTAVPPMEGALVCNLGDMLERLTGGRYRSTAHRVLVTGEDRLSFPFFFDPSWDAVVERLPVVPRPVGADAAERWDHASVHGFSGTYGQYILGKVTKVFPELAARMGRD